MSKKKIILYSFILLFLLIAAGCSSFDQQTSAIRGRFIFDSNRFEVSDVFVTENGKTRLLLKKASDAVWSSDGKMIACSGSDDNPKKYGLCILDSKGNKKEFVEMPLEHTIPSHLNWSLGDKKIYYVPFFYGNKLGYENEIYYYDLLSKTHVKVIELDEKFKIHDLKLSPRGDKFLISGAGPKNKLGVYLSNSDGTSLRIIEHYKGHSGAWYPDNEHIAYITNVTEDRQMYVREEWGYFFKMNVNTGEVEKLWLNKTPFLVNLKISRDGKYIYYAAAASGGGRAVFVSPIDNSEKKIQITYPIFLTPASHGRSQDWNPDWYQD